MKKIGLLLFLAFSVASHAQIPDGNFVVDNGKIIWQIIHETDLSFDQLTRKITESGLIHNMTVSENTISGQIQLIEPDYKGAGHSEMSTPIYIARSFVECFSLIEFKEGRYRVTLRNIVFAQKYNDRVSKEGEKSSIESYALDAKKEMKKSFNKKPSEILNYTFYKSFTFASLDQDNEW